MLSSKRTSMAKSIRNHFFKERVFSIAKIFKLTNTLLVVAYFLFKVLDCFFLFSSEQTHKNPLSNDNVIFLLYTICRGIARGG